MVEPRRVRFHVKPDRALQAETPPANAEGCCRILRWRTSVIAEATRSTGAAPIGSLAASDGEGTESAGAVALSRVSGWWAPGTATSTPGPRGASVATSAVDSCCEDRKVRCLGPGHCERPGLVRKRPTVSGDEDVVRRPEGFRAWRWDGYTRDQSALAARNEAGAARTGVNWARSRRGQHGL